MSDEKSENKKHGKKTLTKEYISKILVFLLIALSLTVIAVAASKPLVTKYVNKAERALPMDVDDIAIDGSFEPSSLQTIPDMKDYEVGKKVAVIKSEKLGLSSDVYVGAERASMRYGSGISTEGTLFGVDGVSFVTGYAENDFAPLEYAEKGDIIEVTTEYGKVRYKVTETSVEKSNSIDISNYSGDTLVLSSIYPMLSDEWESSLVVVAKAVGEVQ